MGPFLPPTEGANVTYMNTYTLQKQAVTEYLRTVRNWILWAEVVSESYAAELSRPRLRLAEPGSPLLRSVSLPASPRAPSRACQRTGQAAPHMLYLSSLPSPDHVLSFKPRGSAVRRHHLRRRPHGRGSRGWRHRRPRRRGEGLSAFQDACAQPPL